MQNVNDWRLVGHAVVYGLKRRPTHVCVCSGKIARVDCKRRSFLVMSSCFSLLFSVNASFTCCQVNESIAERIFVFKILDIDSRQINAQRNSE